MGVKKRSARRPWVVGVAVATLAVAACSRDDDGPAVGEEAEDPPAEETVETAGESRIASGEFGDLGQVCHDGDASGADETGLTDDEIRVGTLTDKGAQIRAGLTQEMYDTAVAFVEWCNEHGGIAGRQLALDDLDAKLFEYGDRITEACETNFAIVGGGAVFDNQDSGRRIDCGLVNIAGYTVTPEARASNLQVQPLPNPVYEFPSQPYRRLQELDPDIDRFGLLWVDFDGPRTIADQVRETVQTLGYEMIFDQQVQAETETAWPNFVREMRDRDVQVVEYIGEPEDLTKLLDAMSIEGWYPDYILEQPNLYDQKLLDEAQTSLGEATYVRTAFAPFEDADQHPAVADYFELMETYNPDGKYPALLGAQGLSAWLLFAQAAAQCGDDLTRDCLLENAFAVDDWTAGGLHAPSSPGNTEAVGCGLFIRMTAEGAVYDEELTDPTDGIYNCDPDNVLELTDDYGVEAPSR